MSVFQKKNKSHLESKMFFDDGVDVARYDTLKYPQLDKLTDKQLGFFWRPEEIDVSKDKSDFAALTDFEKHIFTSNLKRQILLDSVQGRGPAETLMPVASISRARAISDDMDFYGNNPFSFIYTYYS